LLPIKPAPPVTRKFIGLKLFKGKKSIIKKN